MWDDTVVGYGTLNLKHFDDGLEADGLLQNARFGRVDREGGGPQSAQVTRKDVRSTKKKRIKRKGIALA